MELSEQDVDAEERFGIVRELKDSRASLMRDGTMSWDCRVSWEPASGVEYHDSLADFDRPDGIPKTFKDQAFAKYGLMQTLMKKALDADVDAAGEAVFESVGEAVCVCRVVDTPAHRLQFHHRYWDNGDMDEYDAEWKSLDDIKPVALELIRKLYPMMTKKFAFLSKDKKKPKKN